MLNRPFIGSLLRTSAIIIHKSGHVAKQNLVTEVFLSDVPFSAGCAILSERENSYKRKRANHILQSCLHGQAKLAG